VNRLHGGTMTLSPGGVGCNANPKVTARVNLKRIFGLLPRSLRIGVSAILAVASDGPVYLLPSRICWHMLLAVWSRIAILRPLLTRKPMELTFRQRIEHRLLTRLLGIPDGRYRRALARLDDQLKSSSNAEKSLLDSSRHGVMMMIGTLGPGGSERQLVVTAEGLHAKKGASISVACVDLSLPANKYFVPELEAAGIPVSVIGSEPGNLVTPQTRAMIDALPFELRTVRAYATTLAAMRPEIVHLWLDEVNVKGGIAAVLTGVQQIIISQRSLPPTNFGLHQPYMREVYRWLARKPGVKMINNSAAGARGYEIWLGLPQGTIGVIRNGYAFDDRELLRYRAAQGEYRRRAAIPSTTLVVGAVMRLTEEKRPLLWLEIAAHVRQTLREVHFVIVGDGPMRSVMEERASRSDLAGSVHFTGILKNAMCAVTDMDLLLLASRAEGLPNVLIEAQFLGVPVVAPPVGGVPEAIYHGKSGWLLRGSDPKSYAHQIVRLLQDEQWRNAAIRHGPEFAFARFGMQRAIDETLAVYGGTMTGAKVSDH